MKIQKFFIALLIGWQVLGSLAGCSKMTAEKASLYLAKPNKDHGQVDGSPRGEKTQYSLSSGTGFFITADGVLVTNHHVVEGAKHIAIYYNNEFISAELLKFDSSNDLALIKVSLSSRPAPLATSFKGNRGEEVFTLGYPISDIQGMEQKASFGRINARTGFKDDIRSVQVDVPIHPGNSGGPLFNTRGEVIGVVEATLGAKLINQGIIPQNIGYAIKADYIWPLLKQAGINPTGKAGGKAADLPALVSLLEMSVVQIYTLQ